MKILSIIFALSSSTLSIAQTPCQNGIAGAYPCKGIDLMSHLSAQDLLAEEHEGIWLNDIWGWTDSDTGKEYALIGMSNGTSFVDVSDPVNPIFLGKLNEHNFSGKPAKSRLLHDEAKSVWRDIKVYKNHAYIVSEDEGHGMQVFDLTQLRGVTTPQTFTETAIYQGIGRAHNIVINEMTGFAYAVGANTQDKTCTEGGLHIIDISTPSTPVYRACFDTDGYTHDAQCVIYDGPDEDYKGMEICFNANVSSITLVNVDDKDNITMITKKEYSGVQYAHQGWLTEDHKYFLTNDELDEIRNGSNTKTLIWDVQDLDNLKLVAAYEHNGSAIDHNLYIGGNLAYESNYTSGLRVMDLTDVAQGDLSEIAYFDTYPSSDATEFFGIWSNYPFFSSGTIVISDITNGLFIVKINDSLFPIANFNYSIDDKEVSFTNTSTFADSFEWDFGDDSATSSEENPKHEYETGGSYDVKLIATNSNGRHEAIQNISFPTADFNYSIDAKEVSFTNTSTFADSFEWDFGDDSATSSEENPKHEYETGGSYDVKLIATNSNGRHEAIQNISFVYTGTRQNEKFADLSIYPNPTLGQLTINLGNAASSNIQAKLTNLKGQVVLQRQFVNGKSAITIDTHHIPYGIYYLTLHSSQGAVTKKVIIK